MKPFKPIVIATNNDIKIEIREVYVVRGSNKAYLSKGGALNELAYVRAQEQFDAEDKESNFPPEKIYLEDGSVAYHNGKMRPEFMERQAQVLEELKAEVRREKDKIALRKKYQKAMREMDLLNETISKLEIQIADLD
ncbi:hypothetical protein ID858_14045 [Xenorhabdus sp. DI]|uniref:hypothetical protein n=1 Tax=Xenorhabdus doucetiae TaxID=351671 RepID=UPI0019830F5D|nr:MULTISPECIES: hypothetical protein [unclassified Xenorhabdus]MBD2784160.1 hypothetical protein [Xenorhabdus sp. 3]MBD2789626.1 hypothetical protein [Xenorhabdus sp. DI]